ncbi:MAG TPA: hypothetical protein VIH82_07930 [Acidimicrobiia bacterium]|jgi:hypothetical protein
MPKGIFLALANAASDDVHDDFNQWYDDVHSKEVLALDGVRSCRRFKLASAQIMPDDDAVGRQYLALYEVEVDDWSQLSEAMMQGFTEGRITIDPNLLQMDPMVKTMVFEEISPEITA